MVDLTMFPTAVYEHASTGDVVCRDAARATDPLHRLLARHEAALERLGWDQPPRMMILTGRDAARPVLANWELPHAWWQHAETNPKLLLPPITATIRSLRRLPPGDLWPRDHVGDPLPMWGMVTCTEGWALKDRAAEDELRRRKTGDAPIRRFADHPQRIEVRTVGCWTVHGRYMQVSRIRDETPVLSEHWGQSLAQHIEHGAVLCAMRQLVLAATSVYSAEVAA